MNPLSSVTSPDDIHSGNNSITRRRFLSGTTASLVGMSLLPSPKLIAAEREAKIKLALIGCGGRGRWIANLFQQHGGYEFVAVADYFADKAEAAAEPLKVAARHRFTGLNGYRHMLESVEALDAVVIESPPYFHPEQAAAAVAANKHVYLAKPIAVDVPGCGTVEEAGRNATARKRCFLVDFQTRANPLYQDAARRLHANELGKIISAEAAYHCGPTWEQMDQLLRQNPNNAEVRLKAWGVDRVLSGDVITEQNIHAIDVACWMLNDHPVKAIGTSARRRDFVGDCRDQFSVIFYYPNDVILTFNAHQSGWGFDDIMCRVFGMNGVVDTHYFGKVMVKTRDYHNAGDMKNLYTEGTVGNIATFHRSIIEGDCSNPTVAASVRSNLASILGRTAAYRTDQLVTWDEMMKANEKWAFDPAGLKA